MAPYRSFPVTAPIPDDVLPLVGAVVKLGADGKATTSYPVTRADDRKAVEAIKRKAEKARHVAERTTQRDAGIATAEPDADAPKHSDALSRTLTGAKTLGLQAAFASQTETTIRMLAHTMFARSIVDYQFNYRGPALGIRFEDARIADDMRAAAPAAVAELERMKEHWGDVIPGDEASRARWFLQADFDKVLDVLAFVTALQVDVIQQAEKGGAHWVAPSASIAPYAQAIQYDAREWFTPTAEHYFGRVSKALMLSGLTDAGVGAEDLAKVGKAKKAEAAATAEQLVAAGRWVPTLVRVD